MSPLLMHCIGGRLACTGLWYTAGPSNVWQRAPSTVGMMRIAAKQCNF